jgi:hypothetical protein
VVLISLRHHFTFSRFSSQQLAKLKAFTRLQDDLKSVACVVLLLF